MGMIYYYRKSAQPTNLLPACHGTCNPSTRRHPIGNKGRAPTPIAAGGTGRGACSRAWVGNCHSLSQSQAARGWRSHSGRYSTGRESTLRDEGRGASPSFSMHNLPSSVRRPGLPWEPASLGTARLHCRAARRDALRALFGLRQRGESRRAMSRPAQVRLGCNSGKEVVQTDAFTQSNRRGTLRMPEKTLLSPARGSVVVDGRDLRCSPWLREIVSAGTRCADPYQLRHR